MLLHIKHGTLLNEFGMSTVALFMSSSNGKRCHCTSGTMHTGSAALACITKWKCGMGNFKTAGMKKHDTTRLPMLCFLYHAMYRLACILNLLSQRYLHRTSTLFWCWCHLAFNSEDVCGLMFLAMTVCWPFLWMLPFLVALACFPTGCVQLLYTEGCYLQKWIAGTSLAATEIRMQGCIVWDQHFHIPENMFLFSTGPDYSIMKA